MINEKSINIALLRTRGISKKDIFKIQLFKGSIFLIIGTVIGITGILSAYTILNSMEFMLVTTVPRFLIIPWFSLILEISIIIFIFITVILISTYIVTKQSNVDKISTIFRSV